MIYMHLKWLAQTLEFGLFIEYDMYGIYNESGNGLTPFEVIYFWLI